MSINLEKGGRINLSKEAPGLKNAGIGLGWDINATDTGAAFDLDASVFMLGANGENSQRTNTLFSTTTKSRRTLL